MITRYPIATVALFLLAAPVFAQTAGAQTAPTPTKTALDWLRYDAQTEGALVFVGDDLNFGTDERAQANLRKQFAGKTPANLGDVFRRRPLRVGAMTALVPREMPVIVTNPGKPNPFAGMREYERLTLLMSLLTPEQWKLFGGASGIGANDLTGDQRPLFAGLIPASFTRQSLRPSPTGTGYVPDKENKPQTVLGETVRLRAVRRLTFGFLETKDGKDEASYGMNIADVSPGQKPKTFADGAEGFEMLDSNDRPIMAGEKPEALSAFGRTLIQTVPNRLKAGQLSLDLPAMGAGVSLYAGAETVGDLLRRVAKATDLNLQVERRYARQSVTCRLPKSGATVAARDVLTVLCRSLNATFRRLDAPESTVYLLTFDVEGIGVHLARLDDWGESADTARRDAQSAAEEKVTKSNSFAVIGYAPDEVAAPVTLLKSLDTFYETGKRTRSGMPLTPSELTPALRETFREKADFLQKEGHAVRTDKLNLAAELGYDFVLPDNTAFASQLYTVISLASLVRRESVPDAPKPAPKPLPMPQSLKKRVVILPLQTTDADARRLFALAKTKGFTEIWLRASLYAAETPERMATLVALGKEVGLPVGAVVSWLKRDAGETFGTEDINLLGETGTQYATRNQTAFVARRPEDAVYIIDFYRRFTGWTVPDATPALSRLTALAHTKGLSALVLTDTAAPGYAEENKDSRIWKFQNGKVGYTMATRLLCLREEGFDPVDVAERPASLSLNPDVVLPQEDARLSLAAFRTRLNARELIRLFPAVRGTNATLPIFLDDRIPFGITENGAFVRWDAANRLPPTVDGNGDGMASRKTFGTESLYSYQPGSHQSPLRNAIEFGEYAHTSAKGWRGLVYDANRFPAVTAEKNIEALPDAPPVNPATAPPSRRLGRGSPR